MPKISLPLPRLADAEGRPDPKVVPIAVPGSMPSVTWALATRKDVSDVVAHPKKRSGGYGSFRPRNTLNEESRLAASRSDSTRNNLSNVVARHAVRATEGSRSSKRRKQDEAIEDSSDSDDEDPLSKDPRRPEAPRSNVRQQLRLEKSSAGISRRPRNGLFVASTQEYGNVEQRLSSTPYVRDKRKYSQLSPTRSLEMIADSSNPQQATRTSLNIPRGRAALSGRLQRNTDGSARGIKSRYFEQKDSDGPGNDIHNAIDVDDQEIIWNQTDLVKAADPTGRFSKGRAGADDEVEPSNTAHAALGRPGGDSKIRHRLNGERTPRSGPSPSSLGERPAKNLQLSTSKVKKLSASAPHYSLKEIITNHHPGGLQGEFSLVLNAAQSCLALNHEGKIFEDDLVHFGSINKLTFPQEKDATTIRIEMAVRQHRPNIVILQCATHQTFIALAVDLQERTKIELKSADAERFARMTRKFQYENDKKSKQRDDRAELRLMRENKRRRDAEEEVVDVEEPETKKARIKPHLRDNLRGVCASNEQGMSGGNEQFSNRIVQPKTSEVGGDYTTTYKRPTRRYSGIDEILDTINPRQPISKRLGLRSRDSKQSAETSEERLFDMQEFPEHLRHSVMNGLGRKWKRPLTFPKEGKRRATVEFSDLPKLDEGQCLNDSLIEFYLRYLIQNLETESPESAKNVYFFNTYFYSSLKGSSSKINYNSVKKWTRNVDLFTYDYVVVPINEAFHWYIAIICNLPSLTREVPSMRVDSDEEKALSHRDESKHAVVILDARQHKGQQEDLQEGLQEGLHEQDVKARTEPEHITRAPEPDTPMRREEEQTRASFSGLTLDDKSERPKVHCLDEGTETRDTAPVDKAEDIPSPSRSSVEARVPKRIEEANAGAETISESPTQSPGARNGLGKRKGKRRPAVPPKVLDPEKPAIVTLDSLGLPHSAAIRALKDYLCEEAKEKRGGTEIDDREIKGMTAKGIPQQSNFCDCGLYLLGYMDKFVENPKEFSTKLLQKRFDEERDWPKLKPSDMRAQVRDLITRLHKEQENERNDKPKKLPRASDVRPQAEPQVQAEISSGATRESPGKQLLRRAAQTDEDHAGKTFENNRACHNAPASPLPTSSPPEHNELSGPADPKPNVPTTAEPRSRTHSLENKEEVTVVVPDSQDEASLRNEESSQHNQDLSGSRELQERSLPAAHEALGNRQDQKLEFREEKSTRDVGKLSGKHAGAEGELLSEANETEPLGARTLEIIHHQGSKANLEKKKKRVPHEPVEVITVADA